VAVIDPQYMRFVNLKPEYSHSYEVGVKTQFDQRRGTFNLTYFHQDFSNFQYSNAGLVSAGGYIFAAQPVQFGRVPVSGLGANVPVKVNGIESDMGYRFSPDFNVAATLSYVVSKVSNGTVACNQGSPGATALNDGQGNTTLYTCPYNGPASFTPRFSATVRGEYSHELNDRMSGYLRGQLAITGATQVNSDLPWNKQKAYALLNVYAGVHDAGGAWDLSVFVKNLTNTQVVLANSVGNQQEFTQTSATSAQFSPYATVGITPPRQIGVNLRYAFGAR
jgi:iron complex outermembrane receptor protein